MTTVNIVLFWFADDWGKYGRAYERVAQHLSDLDEVSCVYCIFPPPRRLASSRGYALEVRPVGQKLVLFTESGHTGKEPKGVLGSMHKRVDQFLRDRALRAYFRTRGVTAENTVLWLFPPHPYVDRLLRVVPRLGTLTHIIDDFTKFEPGHALHINATAQYPKVGDWSDMIITTSAANFEKFSQTGKPCYLFGPAVDESFLGRGEQLPHRASGSVPHLGYVGWIMDRTDLELVAHVAQSRPDWRISLVGPEYPEGLVERSGVLALPNVEYRGAIPQAEVPGYLQELDVCLMPHKDNEYSRSMGPLKLYQYLASGRPLVSTRVAGLEQVQPHVRVADSYADFVDCIEAALAEDTPELAEARIAAARRETWDIRARQMFEAMRTHILNYDASRDSRGQRRC